MYPQTSIQAEYRPLELLVILPTATRRRSCPRRSHRSCHGCLSPGDGRRVLPTAPAGGVGHLLRCGRQRSRRAEGIGVRAPSPTPPPDGLPLFLGVSPPPTAPLFIAGARREAGSSAGKEAAGKRWCCWQGGLERRIGAAASCRRSR
jgi:hypothetical protein